MEHLPFAIPLYVVILLGVYWMNKREFARSPEKGVRYKALPLIYKCVCWFGIIPLMVASILIHLAFSFLGLILYAALEIACVTWYRKNGYWGDAGSR